VKPPHIEVGDTVFVLAKYIKMTRPTKKLLEKYLGPFEVMDKPNMSSYQIKLPHYLRAIYLVFHILQLEPVTLSKILNHTNFLPPLVIIESELEYEISQVLDAKLDYHCKLLLLYFVCWLGYEGTDKKYLWLSISELSHMGELVRDFHT